MTVILAGRQVTGSADLSQPALLVLSCIDGGNEWLAYAIATPRNVYAFEDEMALVVAAQQGLHATPLVLLPKLGLIAGAARLIALSAADLQVLVAVEAGSDAADPAAAQKLLTAEGLATATDLAGADALLKSLGVAGAPLFQALSLGDRLALLELKAGLAADGAPSATAQKAAARFAADWSYSPAEFTDYLRAFLALTTGANPLSADAARDALAALAPLLFDTLDCPAVAGFVAPQELAAAVAGWIAAGRRVGFSRLSRGVWQLVVHGGYRGQIGADAKALIAAHLDQAHALLAEAVLDRARLAQDGASASFTARAPDRTGEAGLQLNASGAITLQRFVPAPVEGESQ
ncbi:hypothetical protein HZY97_19990 [Sphingomonas sp. R-74633]|uniref:hypothetical protein n=1 Tax=Sphingomonas sp. R-74633 TaxID=2751188 RepID=UPI0015D2D8D6|nr:hypothetical protein [Sphingomonas sp. R-74633]NYT43066.1 hypothetical protein [Sphingomonas sp. R-74633]